MNIFSTRQSAVAQPGRASSPAQPKKPSEDKEPANSAFSVERDIAYTVGATIGLGSNFMTQAIGPAYGAPQIATTGVGALMAAAGAKELMENNSLRGRINGGIHLAVGAMTAAAPWSGSMAVPLYLTSMTALGIKAFADRPGGVLATAGKEAVTMAKEVFTKWQINSVEPQ